jgi:hypothetical protein
MKAGLPMLQLAHYCFSQVFLSMARWRPYCRVIEVAVLLHQQTLAGRCGWLKIGLSSRKTFTCRWLGCGFGYDRGVNGSRNGS